MASGAPVLRTEKQITTQAVEQDVVHLLYRHLIASIMVSLVGASGLAVSTFKQIPQRQILSWWLVLTTVLALRGLDAYRFFKIPRVHQRDPLDNFRRFSIGLISAATVWGLFALLFLRRLNLTGRATTVIILCGMVGGSATVLSPSRFLANTFTILLVLPASLLFLTMPGADNTFFGILGCGFLAVMIRSSRITNESTMTALRLSRANEGLLSDMAVGRERTLAANQDLQTAQAALREANNFLEFRIRARTADLEREMKEKEAYAARLAILASTDPLTGLYNRATLSTYLAKAIGAAERSGSSIAVLFLDLDKFKEVNDVMGHIAGDLVLKAVADRLAARFSNLKLARWGGDEFVVVVEDIQNSASSLELGQALRECVATSIEINHRFLTVDGTVGIALYPQHARTQEELIWAADVAMFAAKAGNTSHIKLFDSDLSATLVQRHQLEKALREAPSDQTLSLVFQPVLNAVTGHCDAMETLVRWNHPTLGSVAPADFIPIAERTGAIVQIGRWVLSEACRQAVAWSGLRPPAVAVNISTAQIESGTLVHDVLTALDRSGLPAARLHLELTESLFATEQSGVVAVLSELRSYGIRILLDDFGTGFSCLAYLRRLPVDLIKIDRSFVIGLEVDSAPIIESIVTTARAFGLQLVAEGVENAAQAKLLVSMGVDYLQGHWVSGPLSPQAAQEWLAAHRIPSLRKAAKAT